MATLDEAILTEADLRETSFVRTKLFRSTLTGAFLYGTARDDWEIDGVKCDYVYWDNKPSFCNSLAQSVNREKERCWLKKHRVPRDRDFLPGEFEELYKRLPTFTYYFEQGFTPLDPLIMDRVVQAINEQHKEFKLDLVNFDKRGQPHATFTVCQMEFVEAAQQQVSTDYERRLAALEGKQEQMMELFAQLANSPKTLELTMGDKRVIETGRDYLEHVENSEVTTGNCEHKGE